MTIVPITDGKRHLVCIPYTIDNLHAMARALGIRRCWYHRCRLPHYDIPLHRIEGVMKVSRVVSSKKIVEIIKTGLKKMKN